MPPRAGNGRFMKPSLRGDGGGLRLLRMAEIGQEERLVDSALEDRDAHLHALRDDFLALEASLASQFGGRQVICHWQISLPWDCLQRPAHIARVSDISKRNRRSVQRSVATVTWICVLQIGFGTSTKTWRTPKRAASSSPSRRTPNVSVA